MAAFLLFNGELGMVSSGIDVKIAAVNALPHLFSYLNDPQIPATTNRLESFFKHLKEKLLLHSGLRLEARRNFIKWYLHLKNNSTQKFF